MGFTLDENHAQFQVRAYSSDGIQINETIYTQSLIISPTRLIEHWPPQSLRDLRAEHLSCIIELSPAILLIGTGETLEFPQLDVYGTLINEGIGIEIMNTGAACRTYNALTAENRNVAAALILG